MFGMYQTAINTIRKAFNGAFGGLFNASHLAADLQEQHSACESYFMDLEGQMKEIQDSFGFRMVSWLLPKRIENPEGGIGNVPVLQRLLSSFPVVGGFWKSRQDLQLCQLKVQTLERNLESVKTDLKPIEILGKFLPDFVTGTEDGTIVPQMSGGNWFRVAMVGMFVAGNVLLWKFLSKKEEEKEQAELGKNVQLEMENQNEFLDRELESAWEEVHSRCQLESKLKEEKKELKADIQLLFNAMETLQKDKENEIEDFSTKMQDLQLTNEQLKSELSNREITIGDHLDDLTEKDHKISGLNDQLEKVHGENEARVKRESKLEKEIEELKVETLCLSIRIETLQKDKENEIENFSTKMQDLQLTNEQLKSELSNREITIGDHLDDLTEKDHKISGLNDQLEKVHGENEARVKRESKLMKEIKDLKVETLGLSQRIETLQIEKEIEIEKFSAKLQDLQETNDHLNEELSDEDASIGEYLNKSIEMEQINLDMCDRLARVEDEKIASIHWLESRFKDKIVEFEEIIGEMKTEKERLEMSLTEARVNDLVRNGRYNCLLEELKALKEEYSHKFSEMEQKNREMSEELEKLEGEKVASIHRLESVFEKKIDELASQLGIIGEMNTEKERLEMSLTEAKMKNLTSEGNYTSSSTEMAKETIVQITKENVGLKDELLAANEITSSLKEELEGRDKKKELNRPGTRKVRLNRSGLEILTKMDGQKEDVQKDVSVNEEEVKVVQAAEDLDSNGHKEEKEVVGGPSGVGAKVGANPTRDYALKGHVTVALDVPRKFHRAIYGVEGKTLMEITRQSGVSSIDMPRRHEYSNLITISGTIGYVQLAADIIDRLLKRLTGY
ncbi:putative leucine-rich repeat-containing protein DDB_G0290503 [Palaemon carinicauda]|uniref:putative leucine-rich repeat-containing protein DDB_G0290503 n=1 Tax=Palaemon carinicauda TaxID=392227 RepID=UPI0035B65E86